MNKNKRSITLFFISNNWSGLHHAFAYEDWEKIAGVPLVPLYWQVLAEKGHQVHVFITGSYKKSKDFQLKGIHFHLRRIPDCFAGAVKGRNIRTFSKLYFILHTLKCTFAVLKYRKTSPPDIIYTYNSGSAFAGYVLSKVFRIPCIAHYWGTWISHYLFNRPWYKRWRALTQMIAFKLPVDLLIVSNDGTEGDKAAKKLKIPKKRFRFWLDGTSSNLYQPDIDKGAIKKALGLRESDKMIFMAARLDSWKRVDRAVKAMPDIIQQYPGVTLVVAGDGNLRKDLELQAKESNVEKHIKFLGFIPHSEVIRMHNAADIFLTVQDLTNLGNQILEALHSGTCVVAYDIGGTSHVMIDGETGILVQKEDLAKLPEIIIHLLNDDAERQRLAMGALRFAKENIWDWDKRIEMEIDEVFNVLDHKKKRPKQYNLNVNPAAK